MECPVVVDENREKQIERLYFLLLEEYCNSKMRHKIKYEIRELWENNQNLLDAWVLYFLILQKERDIIEKLEVDDTLSFHLLNKINTVVNKDDNSLIVGQKTKEEVKEIIHNCVYKVIKVRFDNFFSDVLPQVEDSDALGERKKRLRQISRIINNFNDIFVVEQDYKRKIAQIVIKSAQKRQEEIYNENLAWVKWAEKKYNQKMNFCLLDFLKILIVKKNLNLLNLNLKEASFGFLNMEVIDIEK